MLYLSAQYKLVYPSNPFSRSPSFLIDKETGETIYLEDRKEDRSYLIPPKLSESEYLQIKKDFLDIKASQQIFEYCVDIVDKTNAPNFDSLYHVWYTDNGLEDEWRIYEKTRLMDFLHNWCVENVIPYTYDEPPLEEIERKRAESIARYPWLENMYMAADVAAEFWKEYNSSDKSKSVDEFKKEHQNGDKIRSVNAFWEDYYNSDMSKSVEEAFKEYLAR